MSKKFKRSLLTICSFALVCVVALGFGGCKKKSNPATEQGSPAIVWTIDKAYAQAQSEGFTGTFEEFLQKLTTISNIKLDDLGRLIFTMNDGTVITAGSVSSGAAGRGIESVETDSDRWGLVVTTTYTFTDGGQTTTTYTTSPMYGREYDFVTTNEFDYLVSHGVKSFVLADGIDYATSNFTLNLAKDVDINLNNKTISANKFVLNGEGDISVTLRNGTLKTENGVEISVPDGDLIFEDVVALDKNGVFDLDASVSSMYFRNNVAFLKGVDNGIDEPTLAKVNIPADTRVVIEEGANLGIESIEVVDVDGYEVPLTVVLNSDITVTVNGDALVSGEYMANVDADNITNATVQIGNKLYADLNAAMDDFTEGTIVHLIANTTWDLDKDTAYEFRFAIYYNGHTVTSTAGKEYLTFLKATNDHYVQVNKSGDDIVSVKVLKCEDHQYPEGEGYCSVCGHEGDFEFVVEVDGKKYLTFEEVAELLNTEAKFKMLRNISWSSTTEITINFAFEIDNPDGYEFEIATPNTIKLADTFYFVSTNPKVIVAQCTSHDYEGGYGYCVVCGHEDTEGNYTVKVGDKKYADIDAIIEDGEFKNRVVIDLIKNTTWNIEGSKEINFSVTIRFNNFELDGNYADEGVITWPEGVYRDTATESTTTGGAFIIKRCDAHDFGSVYEQGYGYCKYCKLEDEEADFVLEVVDGKKYGLFDTFVESPEFKDGVVVNLLKNATWTIYEELEIDFEFTVNLNGKAFIVDDKGKDPLDANSVGYLTFKTPYYLVKNTTVYKSVECGGESAAHEYSEAGDRYVGYCVRCGHEDTTSDQALAAVAEVKEAKRKFVTFDDLINQGFIYQRNVVIDLIAKENKTIEYNFSGMKNEIDGPLVINRNGMTLSETTLESLKISDTYHLVTTETQYIIECVEHDYDENSICVNCGAEQESQA